MVQAQEAGTSCCRLVQSYELCACFAPAIPLLGCEHKVDVQQACLSELQPCWLGQHGQGRRMTCGELLLDSLDAMNS